MGDGGIIGRHRRNPALPDDLNGVGYRIQGLVGQPGQQIGTDRPGITASLTGIIADAGLEPPTW